MSEPWGNWAIEVDLAGNVPRARCTILVVDVVEWTRLTELDEAGAGGGWFGLRHTRRD